MVNYRDRLITHVILHGLGWALSPSRRTFRSRASCALRSATESFFLITKGKKCKVKFFFCIWRPGGDFDTRPKHYVEICAQGATRAALQEPLQLCD